METREKINLILRDNNKNIIKKESIVRPETYISLQKTISMILKINRFNIISISNNKEIEIKDDNDYQKIKEYFFNEEEKKSEESISVNSVFINLNTSEKNILNDKYFCNICSDELTENPYFCYNCQKRLCKICFNKLAETTPMKCPFCRFVLPQYYWQTLKNFNDEKSKHLMLIQNYKKLEKEICIDKKIQSELLQKNQILKNENITLLNEKNKSKTNINEKFDEETDKDNEINENNYKINKINKNIYSFIT